MWKTVILVTLILQGVEDASVFPCPDSCKCTSKVSKFDNIELKCSSLDFLNKLQPKSSFGIVKLNISHIGLKKLPSHLKRLTRLESLDASHNKIDSLSDFPHMPNLEEIFLRGNLLTDVTRLPLGLKNVDVSSNNIHHVSKEWLQLAKLRTINFEENPIECNCETLLHYNKLLQKGVSFENVMVCSSPEAFKGKPLNSVNCSMVTEDLLNKMMASEAEELGNDPEDLDESYNEDDDFIAADDTTGIERAKSDKAESLSEEGSGDEGSGAEEIIEVHPEIPKACYINCSTPPPVTGKPDPSSVPSLNELQQILFQDIFGIKETEETTKTVPHESIIPVEIPKETDMGHEGMHESDKDMVEMVATKEVVTGEMERAVMGSPSQNSSLTYYVLGGLLVAFIALILIVTLRKRSMKNKRMRRKPAVENGHFEEMKPLNSNGKALDSKPTLQKVPEITPLMRDSNGREDYETPSKKYVEANSNKPSENDKVTEQDEVPLQPLDTLKVTIKASEIPDSIPKTPVLIHRQLGDDGNYKTTFEQSP